MHLKDSNDNDLYMLIFWTLSIGLVFKTRRFIDWVCLRPQMNKTREGVLLAFSKGPNRVGQWTTSKN
jgi:hypothetical protein